MSQITWADKVTLDAQPDIARINKVIDEDMNEIKSAHNDTDNKVNDIGKLLWEGSFSSGSITVNGISNYNTIVIEDRDGVILYGNQNWGIGGFNEYGSYTKSYRTYRFNYDSADETLTITNDDRGATDGTQTIPIIKIYGLF